MHDIKTVAEEIIEEKQKTENNRRRKPSDRIKAERAKDRIRMPTSIKSAFDLRRVKKLSDLPELE